MEGLKVGLMPFGNIIGDTLPKKGFHVCGFDYNCHSRSWSYVC